MLADYTRFLGSAQVSITELRVFLSQYHVLLSYKMQNECVRKNFYIYSYYEAFTIAHAHLRLYKMLQMFEHRVNYSDMDSIIFINDEKSEQTIKSVTGNQLGQ